MYNETLVQTYFSSRKKIKLHTKCELYNLNKTSYRSKIGHKITKLLNSENWNDHPKIGMIILKLLLVYHIVYLPTNFTLNEIQLKTKTSLMRLTNSPTARKLK